MRMIYIGTLIMEHMTIVEDEVVTQYVIPGICKAASILGMVGALVLMSPSVRDDGLLMIMGMRIIVNSSVNEMVNATKVLTMKRKMLIMMIMMEMMTLMIMEMMMMMIMI